MKQERQAMSNRTIINGIEYPTLSEACNITGLNYRYARIKAMKSDVFEMKQRVKVKIIRDKKKGGSVE